MKTYHLPDDFFPDSPCDEDEVIIKNYASVRDSKNNKIILNRNMISLIIKGRKTVVYPEETAVIKENELVVLSTGNILTSEVLSDTDGFSSVILYFNNEILNRFLLKYNHFLDKKQDYKPFLIYKQDTFIRQYAKSLQVIADSASPVSPEIKLLKLEELFLYLHQIDRNKLQSLQIISTDEHDLRIRKAVDRHISIPATVDEIAFLCNMSGSTFKRKFQHLYGTSPQKWLAEQRLQLAADLLKSSAEIPSQVYYKAGYKNHSSFSAAFRQYFGLTPSAYQSQQLNVLR